MGCPDWNVDQGLHFAASRQALNVSLIAINPLRIKLVEVAQPVGKKVTD